MNFSLEYPAVFFVAALLTLQGATWIGTFILGHSGGMDNDVREDFSVILTAILTMLALLIGFCFSMAISRYDQRKNYEEAEANAIGTEYLRADLLPTADAARVRELLRNYLDLRILFYTTRDESAARQISTRTAALQNELWASVLPAAKANATPAVALAISGMNDVLNAEGYTQAAWWNRIPLAAWALLVTIGFCCNVMLGYGARKVKSERKLLSVVPIVVATSFFLIADIDSPRGGVIRVHPQNLERLVESLRTP